VAPLVHAGEEAQCFAVLERADARANDLAFIAAGDCADGIGTGSSITEEERLAYELLLR
jgi:hypothetical protein